MSRLPQAEASEVERKTASPERPNILWICTDQQRFDTLRCYGNPFVDTPHIDRLAKTGTLFERAFCQNPVCTPSRASFLTGRYPRTTRCRQNGQSIPADEVLLPRLFRDAGYRMGLSGKLHLSACHPRACFGHERRIDDGYHEFHWSHHPAADWPANEYQHWLRENKQSYSVTTSGDSRFIRVGMPAEYHHSTWCTQKAISFIEACSQARQQRPWMFSLNLYDPHHPFDPPANYLERYRPLLPEIPLPNYNPGELDTKPVWQQIDHRAAYGGAGGFSFNEMSDTDHRWVRAAYWAMIDLIDHQVEQLVTALQRTGQLHNTIVIFTSDHGEMLGDHGIYLKGPYFYDVAIGVPLLISWPGRIAAGQRSAALVELVDLAPTLLQAAGMPIHPGMQGRSLWPILTGGQPTAHHRDDVYSEFYASNFRYQPAAHTTMVRTEQYKLTVAHGQGTGELYDLGNDPEERHNRWCDPSYQHIKTELLVRLADRMAWTVDPLPLREAPW